MTTLVFSRVPRGLLFLLYYVNDIPLSVDNPTLLFANDAKIFCSIGCEADYLQLQHDIAKLYEWLTTWLLNFNISKYYLLQLTLLQYCINVSEIAPTESVKDLGIIVDSSLKFHMHTSTVAAKANRVLAIINK